MFVDCQVWDVIYEKLIGIFNKASMILCHFEKYGCHLSGFIHLPSWVVDIGVIGLLTGRFAPSPISLLVQVHVPFGSAVHVHLHYL